MTMKPPHPGETLKYEYLVPLGMSVNAFARNWDWRGPPERNRPWTTGRQRRYRAAAGALFGTTPELWLNLQAFYDLRMAPAESGRAIDRMVNPPGGVGLQVPRAGGGRELAFPSICGLSCGGTTP